MDVVPFPPCITKEDKKRLETTTNVKLVKLAVSLGGVQSLVEIATAMTHPEKYVSVEERKETGLKESLIRFSVGLENAEDLKKDLEHALEKV